MGKNIAYILSNEDLSIKTVEEIGPYEYKIDEETNEKTIIDILPNDDIENGDIVVLKRKGSRDYVGVVEDITNEDTSYKLTLKYITNLFDRKVILEGESTMQTAVEYFIENTIGSNFLDGSDILSYPWLTTSSTTQTPITAAVENEDGIYNLHTFMTNCTQHYNIVYDFNFVVSDLTNAIEMVIHRQTQTEKLVDATTTDVTNFEEIYETDVLAKVTVKTSTITKSWYLRNDKTITDNQYDSNRVRGSVDCLYTENAADAYQTAVDAFKGNSYKHYIKFSIRKNSKLFDVSSFNIGTPLKVKTENGVVETYISAISDVGGAFLDITCGNMRIDFIDKLRKERKQ